MVSVVVYRYIFDFIFLQNILLITLYRCLLHFIVDSKLNLKQMCLFLDREFFLKYTQSMKRNKQNENLKSTIFKQCLLFCVLFGCSISGLAQTSGSSLRSTEAYLNELQSKTATVYEKAAASNLAALLHTKQEAIYITGQNVQRYGTKPRVVFLSLTDINQLSSLQSHQHNIELIQIQVNGAADYPQLLSSELLAGFKNLKYLHFILADPTSSASLASGLASVHLPYDLLYSVLNVDHD